MRGFVDAKKPHVLSIERFAPTDSFQLVVTSEEFASFNQGQRLTIQFGSLPPDPVRSGMAGKTASGRPMLFISSTGLIDHADEAEEIGLPRVTPEMETEAKTITLAYGGRTVVFNTGSLGKAFAALRTCTSNLVKSWGLDPDQQASLTRFATPMSSPGNWLQSNDYPGAMLASGKQAIVNFRLNVDEKGGATACEIQRSFAAKEFDKATCSLLMRRAKFKPALDRNGRPVPSYYINTVRWIM